MIDKPITIEEYIANKGYSSKYFFQHFLYFAKHKPEWVDMRVYRHKIRLINTKTKSEVLVKVHWNGKSKKYVTILDKRGRKELVTFHCSLDPGAMTNMAISFLK